MCDDFVKEDPLAPMTPPLRHAILVMAHTDFPVLEKLLKCLDFEALSIYVHIDRKVKDGPLFKRNVGGGLEDDSLMRRLRDNLELYGDNPVRADGGYAFSETPAPMVRKAHLHILPDDARIDVRWGHISLTECELRLLEHASATGLEEGVKYDFYHIISGNTLPLFDCADALDSYLGSKGWPDAVFSDIETGGEEENLLKIRRWNWEWITRDFQTPRRKAFFQLVWRISNRLQAILNVQKREFRDRKLKKASNWCSLSIDAVKYLIDNRMSILWRYRHTLCCDEYFIPSELENSGRFRCAYVGDYLSVDFAGGSRPVEYDIREFDRVLKTNRSDPSKSCLWARKFIDVKRK